MNVEELPTQVKNDVEDQSLAILEDIRDDIVVVGGWAVRAHLQSRHARHTLDVDGVAEEAKTAQHREEAGISWTQIMYGGLGYTVLPEIQT